MRPHKSTILIALITLLLVAFAVALAQQGATQTDQKKQAETCCAMESCCCNSGSCPMMKKEGATNATAKADAKDGCCCGGDSCEMKKTDAKKNHSEAHEGCCCCSGESCDMSKHGQHDMAKHGQHDMKSQSGDGSCCKMKHKDAKQKEVKQKTN